MSLKYAYPAMPGKGNSHLPAISMNCVAIYINSMELLVVCMRFNIVCMHYGEQFASIQENFEIQGHMTALLKKN
jgi:hypothetical protein